MALGSAAGGVGTNLAASAMERFVASVTESDWESGDELDRLFYLLEAAFEPELPALTVAELNATWRRSAEFVEAHRRVNVAPHASSGHAALVRALEPLLGDTENETAGGLAERLAVVIPHLVVRAKTDFSRVLYEFESVREQLNAQHQELTTRLERIEEAGSGRTLVIHSSDWPSAAENTLKAAGHADPDGLAHLTKALDGKDRKNELPALLARRPPWFQALAGETLAVVALACEEQGLWFEAKAAWLEARDRPGADFAGCSVRAGEAAVSWGDRDAGVALLAEARHSNPEHPRVRFQSALTEEDPKQVLSALAAIDTADPAIGAMVQLARASAHMELSDLPAARADLAAAKQLGAGSTVSLRMTKLSVELQSLLENRAPDAAEVADLIDEALDLEELLRDRNQIAQGAGVRAQISGIYGALGEFDTAREILESAVEVYDVDDEEPRLALAMAASHLRAEDLVGALVRGGDKRLRARYLRAGMTAQGDADDKREAAEALVELAQGDNVQIGRLAAMRRLSLATEVPEVGWSEVAEAIVAPDELEPAVCMKAFWLENSGRLAEAEAELLKHGEEAWAKRELVALAGRNEDWVKAARYGEVFLKEGVDDWYACMSAAEALVRGGNNAAGLREFERIAHHEGPPAKLRSAAYSRLTADAHERKAYRDTYQYAKAWLGLNPDSSDAAWATAMALAMLGRDTEAFAAISEGGLRPRGADEYRLAAQLSIGNIEDPVEGARAVLALADEHDPPSEELEALLFMAAIRAGNALPEELRARVSHERFAREFPASKRFEERSVEDLKRFFERDLAESAERLKDVEDGVFKRGDTPTAVLAVLSSNDMGSLWTRFSWHVGLPMGYSEPQLDSLERSDALATVGGGALWDGTSVFIASHVLNEFSHRFRSALPGSVITQAATADIAEGARRLAIHGGGNRTEVTYNLEAGKPEFIQWDADLEAAYEKRAEDARAFAAELTPVPDSDSDAPQPEDELLEPEDDSAFRAYVATIGTARRLSLAIFSDDRHVRRLARSDGLPTFGTVALIDALEEKLLLSPEQRRAAREQLLQHGAQGVAPTEAELLAMGERASWRLTRQLAVAALDQGPWQRDVAAAIGRWFEVLRAVHTQRPERLTKWVVRVVDAFVRARPEVRPRLFATYLASRAVIPTEAASPEFTRGVLDGLRLAERKLGLNLGDPGVEALVAVLETVRQYDYVDPIVKRGTVLRAWRMLPLPDQMRTLHMLRSV